MKLFTKLFAVALLATTFAANAQELTLSGSVDAYYRANFVPTNGANADGSVGQAPSTSFANGNGFSIGMANVVLGLEGEKSGFVADLVFGPRGNDAVFESTVGSTPIVNQLYAYWNVSDAVTLTMGNFNTYLGYEVISPAANFNYSTSYMFSFGPFSHTGLKADIAVNDDLSLMFAVMNPTDLTELNPVDTYTFGAQVGYKGVYLNILYGDQSGTGDNKNADFQIDLTGGHDLTDEFYVGYNATYKTTAVEQGDAAGFYGAAAYIQYALSDDFSIGTRLEYFAEFEGGAGAIGAYDDGDASVFDVTLTAQYKVGDLTVIPEIRLDAASEDVFSDGSEAQSSLSSFVLAAVYAF